MKSTRLLVLSVSAGAGHVRAAEAICAQARITRPDWRSTHINVMDWVPAAFRKLYTESYIKLVEKAPLLWAYLYQHSDKRTHASRSDRLRRGIEQLNTRNFNREIDAFAADAIICTHFLPAELLSRRIRKGRPTPPVWVQVTDFDVHSLWLHEHMQGYLVANAEVAARLRAKGIESARIEITGIPTMPVFSQPLSRAVAARELGLNPSRPIVLMMSGGAGVGGIEALVPQLAALPSDMQIVALAGRNEALLLKLQAIAKEYPGKVWPMGFTRTVERVMAAADFAITKPGGLTSSECLVMTLPMIVISPIPGQEERNADFLLESGAALKAVDAASLAHKVQLLLAEPERLAAMRRQMKAVATPRAAAVVIESVARHLREASRR